MPIQKLRVRARGTALVQDDEALLSGVRRYIGRVLDASTIDPAAGIGVSFRPTDEAVEVPATPEYVRAVRHGDLWAADQATADYCDIKFDPAFGRVEAPKPDPTPEVLKVEPPAPALVESSDAPLRVGRKGVDR